MSKNHLNHNPLLITPRHPWRRALQIHILNPRLPLTRIPDQISKILPRHLAITLDVLSLLPLFPQFLDRLLETGAEVFGGETEDLSRFVGDAGAVVVSVVEGGEGGGDAGGEVVWKGGGDGVQGVGGC